MSCRGRNVIGYKGGRQADRQAEPQTGRQTATHTRVFVDRIRQKEEM